MGLWFTGCGGEIPADRRDYIGTWEGDSYYLWISAAGQVEYERQKGSGHTSYSGPIKEFVGDDFEVGMFFLTSTFKVAERPHRVGPYWTMTVDGVTLVKTAGSGVVRSPEKVPGDVELVRLARAAMSDFAAAVQAGDLGVLHRSMSVLWQLRNSAADLELFLSSHLRGADFSRVAQHRPVFDQVYIDDEGLLWVEGYFPTAPKAVGFGLRFVYEPPAWALYDINVFRE